MSISGIRILFERLLPNALGMIVVNFLFLIPPGDFYRSIFKLFGGGIICADGKSRRH